MSNVYLKTLNEKVSKFTTSQQHVVCIIFPWFDRFFFLQKRKLLIDFISACVKIWPRLLKLRQSEAVTDRFFFSPAVPFTTSSHGYFVLFQFRLHQETAMAARRTQWSTSAISRKNRGLWTVYCFIGCVAFFVVFPMALTSSYYIVYITNARQCFIRITKHREENWKHDEQRSSFDEILAFWGADETLSPVFDISFRSKE